MMKHVHGGNIYDHRNCVDFSANCNPLGTPKGVIKAVQDSLDCLNCYPQVGYLPLKKAIADYEQCAADEIICGNGAAELIFSVCRAWMPKKALLAVPTFAEYEQALDSVNCQVRHYELSEDCGFMLDRGFLEELTDDLDMVFLCNPNNPTGLLIPCELLKEILELCRKRDIFLVVDECFLDFVEDPQAHTLKPYLESFENLLLLKAFTKRYAMAGLRLGYGITGNRALLEKMDRQVQPWNISVPAQAAGIAALSETEYVRLGREIVFEERKYLSECLETMGLKVLPSQANYLFFRAPEGFDKKCCERGILIRSCGNYAGLQEGWYRIAVRTHEENRKLTEVFQEILKIRS